MGVGWHTSDQSDVRQLDIHRESRGDTEFWLLEERKLKHIVWKKSWLSAKELRSVSDRKQKIKDFEDKQYSEASLTLSRGWRKKSTWYSRKVWSLTVHWRLQSWESQQRSTGSHRLGTVMWMMCIVADGKTVGKCKIRWYRRYDRGEVGFFIYCVQLSSQMLLEWFPKRLSKFKSIGFSVFVVVVVVALVVVVVVVVVVVPPCSHMQSFVLWRSRRRLGLTPRGGAGWCGRSAALCGRRWNDRQGVLHPTDLLHHAESWFLQKTSHMHP